MTEEINGLVKKEILRLIAIPGIEVKDIPTEINSKYKTQLKTEDIMEILSDEYLKHNLDLGRRLCCRF